MAFDISTLIRTPAYTSDGQMSKPWLNFYQNIYPAANWAYGNTKSEQAYFDGANVYTGTIVLADAAADFDLGTILGDLDDIADGSNYGKVALTNISAGHIVLAQCTGDLDDISDGSNWGKVALTSISSGKIIVAGLDSDVTDRMFTSGTEQTNIEGWIHASDVTAIDGGHIYTDTIVADAINGGAFGTLTISSGSIKVTVASGFEIGGGGDLTVDANGDIILKTETGSTDAKRAFIEFQLQGFSAYMVGDYDNNRLAIYPSSADSGDLLLGYDYNGNVQAFSLVDIKADSSLVLSRYSSSSDYANITMANSTDDITLTIYNGSTKRLEFRDDGSDIYFAPMYGSISLGLQSYGYKCLYLTEQTADPSSPSDGRAVIWVSDGTDSGDAGDLMVKTRQGATVKTGTLADFSAL